jgi:ferredoxin
MLAATGRPAARTHPADPVLHIDWTACDGRGLCTELLPELLQRDDWGYPRAHGDGSNIPVPAPLAKSAAAAVTLCPRQALQLREP